jgi:hypothetical protein
MNRFKKFANDNDLDFDPRQKFAPLDDYEAAHGHNIDDSNSDSSSDKGHVDLDFDPRQKFAPLDDWISKHEHTLPMKKENTKPNFKIRRIK